jgi:hypothetical protein
MPLPAGFPHDQELDRRSYICHHQIDHDHLPAGPYSQVLNLQCSIWEFEVLPSSINALFLDAISVWSPRRLRRKLVRNDLSNGCSAL